jgi:hypothetical protein
MIFQPTTFFLFSFSEVVFTLAEFTALVLAKMLLLTLSPWESQHCNKKQSFFFQKAQEAKMIGA